MQCPDTCTATSGAQERGKGRRIAGVCPRQYERSQEPQQLDLHYPYIIHLHNKVNVCTWGVDSIVDGKGKGEREIEIDREREGENVEEKERGGGERYLVSQ